MPESRFHQEIAKITVAKDPVPVASYQQPIPQPKQVTDSGYHGMTEDEMDVDDDYHEPSVLMVDEPEVEKPETQEILRPSEDPSTNAGSFHSAQEAVQDEPVAEKTRAPEPETEPESKADPVIEPEPAQPMDVSSPFEALDTPAEKQPSFHEDSPAPENKMDVNPDNDFEDDTGSPSEASTPDRPVVRKSSLTFASLPAREPLPKKSMGARTSRTSHIDLPKSAAATRTSYFGRSTSGTRVTQNLFDTHDNEMDVDVEKEDAENMEGSDYESKTTKMHNMSSTQRLHEKINMLGKSQPSRPTKSIPSVVALSNSQPVYPELPMPKPEADPPKTIHNRFTADDDDEWIRPLGSPRAQRPHLLKSHTADVMEQVSGKDSIGELHKQENVLEAKTLRSPLRHSPNRRFNPAGHGHKKAASVTEIKTPLKHDMGPGLTRQNTVAVANPATSTTPTGSPKRGLDGPLSASKSKLQSIMKSAKGLFSSSATVSAAARSEALSSPTAIRSSPGRTGNPGYPSLEGVFDPPPKQRDQPDSLPKEGRRTRSSTEKDEKRKDQEAKERQRMDEDLEKAREQQRQKYTQAKQVPEKSRPESKLARPATRTSPRRPAEDRSADRDMELSSEAEQRTNAHGSQQSQSQKEIRRPIKPTREAIQKPKPQPVSIRVGTLSQRIPLSSSTMGSSFDPQSAAASKPQPPPLTKKASSSSLNSNGSASQSLKTSVSSKPKALLAAERKKEQVRVFCPWNSQFTNIPSG